MAMSDRASRTRRLGDKGAKDAVGADSIGLGLSPQKDRPSSASDWLTNLDAKASTLPAADDSRGSRANWHKYSFFMLARYVHLRPSPGDGEQFVVITKLVGRQLSELGQLEVLEGLAEDERFQLGALLVDLIDMFESNTTDRARLHDLEQGVKLAPGRLRRVEGKVRRVRGALASLDEYLEQLGTYGELSASIISPMFRRGKDVRNHIEFYDSILQRLGTVRRPEHRLATLKATMEFLPISAAPTEFKALVTERLTSYFVSGCHLSKTEADIRTAKIGNALWHWQEQIRTKYDPATLSWRGADATRSRRRRRSARRKA